MSVQIKTPNGTNQPGVTFDPADRKSGGTSTSGTSQSHDFKKRRQSQHTDGEDQPSSAKKRRYSHSKSQRPLNHIKLYKGGSLSDPLNLVGLQNRTGPSPAPSPDAHLERLAAAKPPPKISNLADPLNLTIDDTTGQVIGPLSPTVSVRLKRKRLSKKRKEKLEIDFDSDHEVEADHSLFEPNSDDATCRSLNWPDVKSSHSDSTEQSTNGLSSTSVSGLGKDTSQESIKVETTKQSKPLTHISPEKHLSKSAHKSKPPHRPRHKPNKPAAHKTAAQQKPSAKSNAFIHGNYNRYYGYRSCDKMEVDPRVKSMKASWFHGKSVLDIGCNIGHVTLTIARDYKPVKVVGIDIDNKLISIARKNVRYYKDESDNRKFPVSCLAVYGPISVPLFIGSTPTTTVHTTQSSDGTTLTSYATAHKPPPSTDCITHTNPTSGASLVSSHTHPVRSCADTTTASSSATSTLVSAVTNQPISSVLPSPSCSTEPSEQPITETITTTTSTPTPTHSSSQFVANTKSNAQRTQSGARLSKTDQTVSHSVFPRNTSFLCGNYCLQSDELLDMVKAEFDVILALSVTKWIHLNNGDDGIKRCFKRMFLQLNPGGVLVLEPQMWPSYKKKKDLTESIKRNFQEINFRPEQFTEYLLSSEVGFITCERLNVQEHRSKGFRRPMFVFHKSTR